MRSQRHASHPQMRGYSRETLVSHPTGDNPPKWNVLRNFTLEGGLA